jgi:hypothetical protein
MDNVRQDAHSFWPLRAAPAQPVVVVVFAAVALPMLHVDGEPRLREHHRLGHDLLLCVINLHPNSHWTALMTMRQSERSAGGSRPDAPRRATDGLAWPDWHTARRNASLALSGPRAH